MRNFLKITDAPKAQGREVQNLGEGGRRDGLRRTISRFPKCGHTRDLGTFGWNNRGRGREGGRQDFRFRTAGVNDKKKVEERKARDIAERHSGSKRRDGVFKARYFRVKPCSGSR